MTALADKVLVLNKGWLAINVTTVRDAVSLVYSDAAQFVHPQTYEAFSFENWKDAAALAKDASRYLRGCDWKMLVPEVIVLTDYAGISRRNVKFSRKNIFERDRYTCQYCGERHRRADLNLDHVLPKSRGGTSCWENVVLACYTCNSRKDNRLPVEAKMQLLRKPRKPDWRDVKLPSLAGQMPSSWEAFLSEMYWNQELKP